MHTYPSCFMSIPMLKTNSTVTFTKSRKNNDSFKMTLHHLQNSDASIGNSCHSCSISHFNPRLLTHLFFFFSP